MASLRNRGKKALLNHSDTLLTEDSLSLKHPSRVKRFRRSNSKQSSDSSHSYSRFEQKSSSKENYNTENGMPAYVKLCNLISGKDGRQNNNIRMVIKKTHDQVLSTEKKNFSKGQFNHIEKSSKAVDSLKQQNKQLEKKIRKMCREREVQRSMRRQAEDKVIQLQMEMEQLEKDKIKLLTELQASENQKNKFFRQYKSILEQEKNMQFQTAREVSLHCQLSALKKHIEERKSDNQSHLQKIIFNLQAYIQSFREEGKSLQLQNHILEHQVQYLENINRDLEKKWKRTVKEAKNLKVLMKSYREDYNDLKRIHQNQKKNSINEQSEEQQNSLDLSESFESDFQFKI